MTTMTLISLSACVDYLSLQKRFSYEAFQETFKTEFETKLLAAPSMLIVNIWNS